MSAVQSQARVSVLFLLLTIILAFLPNSRRSRGLNHNSRPTVLGANPVTSDGSNYRTDVTEDEAFLWFDEALVHVRAGISLCNLSVCPYAFLVCVLSVTIRPGRSALS